MNYSLRDLLGCYVISIINNINYIYKDFINFYNYIALKVHYILGGIVMKRKIIVANNLLEKKQYDDAKRVTEDEEYCEQLCEEYNI